MTSTPKDSLVLASNSLLSKFGFSDGDLMFDWWWDQFDKEIDETPEGNLYHKVLYALVLKYLIPKIPYKVTSYFVHTNHNPVRIDTVGYENTLEEREFEGTQVVVITKEQVMETYHEVLSDELKKEDAI